MFSVRRLSYFRRLLYFRIPPLDTVTDTKANFVHKIKSDHDIQRTNSNVGLKQKRSSSQTTSSANPKSLVSTSTSNDPTNSELFQQLASLGYTEDSVRKGMVAALEAIYGVGKVNESTLSNFGTSALQTLSESVTRELQSSKSTFIGTVHFIVKHHNFSFDLPCKEGESLMMLAKSPLGQELLAEYLECACGGNMSCATCHVILDPETYDKLEPPSTAELDMLDLAFEPTSTSRLGCQIKMRPDLDGMTVIIPSGVNNFWS